MGCERIFLPSGLLLITSKLRHMLTGKYTNPGEESKSSDVTSCLVMFQDKSLCLSKFLGLGHNWNS